MSYEQINRFSDSEPSERSPFRSVYMSPDRYPTGHLQLYLW